MPLNKETKPSSSSYYYYIYHYHYYCSLQVLHQDYLTVFHWSLSNSKSHQVSRTLLSILTSTMLLFGWSPFVLRFPTPPALLLSLWKLFQVHQLHLISLFPSCSIVFVSFLARSRYLSIFSFSFNFILWSIGMAKFTIWQVLFFLLTITGSGCLAEIMWSICI